MQVDIVIPLGIGSQWRNQELEFSLRSIEKYGKNFRDIYIISENLPAYLNKEKVKHLKFIEQIGNNKEKNIMEKFLLACNTPEISDPFIASNDDYFLMNTVDFSNIPYYYSDTLENKAQRRPKKDIYYKALRNTVEALKEKGLGTAHFDIHYFMAYVKQKFIDVMAEYDWNTRGGFVVKSLYANTLGIVGEKKKDCKVYYPLTRNEIVREMNKTDLFSTGDITRPMILLLRELYPEKSSFEK